MIGGPRPGAVLVRHAVLAYVRAGNSVGVLPAARPYGDGDPVVILEAGSPAAGRAWRLMVDGGRAAPGTGDRGFIGHNAREAENTLRTIARAWHAVADAREKK